MIGKLFPLSVGAVAMAWSVAAGSSSSVPVQPPDSSAVPIVYLQDLSSGQVLLAKDEDRRFMPASITKVMTLYVAFEMIDAGELSTVQRFTISEQAFEDWNRVGSTMFIPAGESVAVDNLLRGIAAVSANDGAIVLAEGAAGSVEAWVAKMNAAAHRLGMRDTHFGTPNGWMDEGRTFTTAADLAKLARALVTRHPTLYAEYVGLPGYRFNNISQDNHDPITGRVDGADGIKTGFTNQSGSGFLGSAVRDGRRLVMVVAGAERIRERNDLARELIEWGFSAYRPHPLFSAGTLIAEARVQDGERTSVSLRADGPVNATVPRGHDGEVRLVLHYEGPLRAPIAEGEQVAELEIAVDGLPPSRVPLYASHHVARADTWQRLRNGLLGIVR